VGVGVGIMFANRARSAEPEHAAGLAREAEAAGYESLWAVQHVAVPVLPAGFGARVSDMAP
jgi:alkanesulfonate monooxygenase SsuD/methylene tetrahydromethanopterin reductase-like flavin-dependent oxidoreductase (luciferase family)